MPVTDAELHLIFQYLDNELSDAEEQQLVQQIAENPELQQAFDQQVLMYNFEKGAIKIVLPTDAFESADAHVNRITEATKSTKAPIKILPPFTVKKWVPLAAAAAVAAIIIAATIYVLDKPRHEPVPVVKIPEKKVTPAYKDSMVLKPDTARLLADNDLLLQLAEKYYSPMSGDAFRPPVEASPYAMEYEQRRHKELVSQNENTVGIKGQAEPDKEQNIRNCFNLYKALSLIELNELIEAKKMLKELTVKAGSNKKLNDQVKWYLLMVYLKTNSTADAILMTTSVASDKSSPYRKEAIEIGNQLNSKN